MKAIMACDPYGGIGIEGRLPWVRLDGDLPRFKELTNNSTIIMGHSTWRSLPFKPLINRTNVVVSNHKLHLPQSVVLINDINELDQFDNAWFIGGANLLEKLWDQIDEFHLTQAHRAYDCDTFIDLLYLEDNFEKISESNFKDNTYEVWQRS